MSDIAHTVVALGNGHWICQDKVQCLVMIHEFTTENLPPQGQILPSVEWTNWISERNRRETLTKGRPANHPKE